MTAEARLREQICTLTKSLMTRGLNPRALTSFQVQALLTKFDVEWDV